MSGAYLRAALGVALACAHAQAAAAPLYALAQPQTKDAPGVHAVLVKVITNGDPAVCRKAMPPADPGMFGTVGAHCVKDLPPELVGLDQPGGLAGAYVVKITDAAAPGPGYVVRFGMLTQDVQKVCRNLLIYDRSSQTRTAQMSCTPPKH